ncbi:dimethylaniline monooxygenase [N-oxide-forming] 2-like [Saccoglossus kowalevskii]|uniref:Flavin-containing monooxygenase n=1 Tax=Saccoglossus kowalevskii TaxID=10224 RepID=A0ABM0MDM4_SACKO|nr:PREDICTED: dimethylaniline monooxygenase [N-oxide-forming] 2-like [Saccoglossus kowalevskii]
MTTKRVAVIGAGISGLVSVKCCNDEGLIPVCFEQGDEIAGLWNYHDELRDGEGAALYESMITNTSRDMTCFSDFPFPKETSPFMRHERVLEYYRSYADSFGLHQFIALNTKVVKVEPAQHYRKTGQWILHLKKEGQPVKQELFDAVMCCTGVCTTPYTPDFDGLGDFKGLILHSNKFRRGPDFRGKIVVVVGASNSAGDIAAEISRFAKQVYISMRDGTWLLQRMGSGAPLDMTRNRRIYEQLPESVMNMISQKIVLSQVNHDKLGLKSNRPLHRHVVMINDDIANRIFCGAVKCKTAIKQLTRNSVEFVDGTVVDDVDAVVCATGYNLTFPYIDNDIIADGARNIELYFRVFPPRLNKPTLAVIGTVRVSGPAGPVSELQARWATRVFKGECKLPDEETMMTEVKTRKRNFFEKFGKHGVGVSSIPYQDQIAEFIGAKPNFWKLLLTDPKLAYAVMFEPCYPATYRLTGPGVWDKARETIMNARECDRSRTQSYLQLMSLLVVLFCVCFVVVQRV